MHTLRRLQRGFSLVELMVGIAVGAVVVLGAISVITHLLRGDALAASRVDQDIRNTAFVFERDVMRAGQWGLAVSGLTAGASAYANPFAELDTSQAGCVRFLYDLDRNGAVTTTSGSDERMAYVLAGGVLYTRTGGANHDCDVTQGTWEPLTDSQALTVTRFELSVRVVDTSIPGSTRVMRERVLSYTLSGQSRRQDRTVQSVTNSVKLPNDIVV